MPSPFQGKTETPAFIETGDRIVFEPERRRMTGLSRTAAWKGAREGRFPKPVRLGSNRHGWLFSELQAWLKGLADKRTDNPSIRSTKPLVPGSKAEAVTQRRPGRTKCGGRCHARVDEARHALVERLWIEGMPIADIAAQLETHLSYISTVVKAHGLPARSAGRRRKPRPDDQPTSAEATPPSS